jgi:hypothetical protein
MASSYIGVTHAGELQALGTGGQLAIERAGPLAALLRRELSPAHAALFAEPHPDPARGEVYWYAEGDGPAVPLAELPDAERWAAQAEFDRLFGEVEALAERLKAGTNEGDRFLGQLLGLALEIPDPSYVRVRGGRPVIIAWGHRRVGERASAQPVSGTTMRTPPPMAILPPPPPPKPPLPRLWGWLLALLGAGTLFVLATLLAMDPFGWFGADVGTCQVSETDLAGLQTYRAEEQREAQLRQQLAALMNDAGRRRLACPVPPAAQPPPQPPPQTRPRAENQPPPSGAEDVRRAQQRGARAGKLQIVLAWNDRNDLDLHVICPDGKEIYFNNRSSCGGVLDIDANARTEEATDTPVENATWASPPPGHYKIMIDPYKMRAARQSRFRVTIRQEGKPDRTLEGTAIDGKRGEVIAEVEIPGS